MGAVCSSNDVALNRFPPSFSFSPFMAQVLMRLYAAPKWMLVPRVQADVFALNRSKKKES